MHCELVVPALFAPSGAASPASAPASSSTVRLPALELLLARSRETHGEGRGLESWLAASFGLEGAAPAGALTAAAAGLPVGHAAWARADPVHLRLMRDRLVVVPAAALAVSRTEADAFCEALNRHFARALEFHPVDPERWCVRLEVPLEIDTSSPFDMAGRDANAGVPRGAGAGQAQALLNEIQMLLHAHALNEQREARGEPTINSVWLWGAAPLPSSVNRDWHSVLAEDPLALGLARQAGVRARGLGAGAAAWLERAPDEGRHLVILDALRAPFALAQEAEYGVALEALERDWFAPLLAALRRGRIGMVTLHAPERGASFEAIRGDLRRFWRRPRALEHYA